MKNTKTLRKPRIKKPMFKFCDECKKRFQPDGEFVKNCPKCREKLSMSRSHIKANRHYKEVKNGKRN